MHRHATTITNDRSAHTRVGSSAHAFALAIALGVTAVPTVSFASGSVEQPCRFSATVFPTAGEGAFVEIQWGFIYGACWLSGASLTVGDGRIDLHVMWGPSGCFWVDTAYCVSPMTNAPTPPGAYEVHASFVNSAGEVFADYGVIGTLVVPEATPCGTIVESDFNDGKLGELEFFDQTLAGVGAYESVDGTARLFTTAAVTAVDEGVLLALPDSETNPDLYADGTIRVAFRSTSSRPFVQIGARADSTETTSFGYFFSAVAEPFDFLIIQRGNGDGTFTTLGQSAFPVDPNVDYEMRATFVGDLIELTLWHAGEVEPAPRISVIDALPILGGGATGFGAGRSQGTGLVDISFSDFSFTLPNECEEPVLGDINGDGVVDGADLGILLNNWGGDGAADLNGDGIVDGADLGLLLNNWG